MAEYIEREALLARLKFKIESDTTRNHAKYRGLESAQAQVRKAPAADVAPVVHSKWMEMVEYHEDGFGEWCQDIYYNCLNCDYATVVNTNYCPNCGAKMDLE